MKGWRHWQAARRVRDGRGASDARAETARLAMIHAANTRDMAGLLQGDERTRQRLGGDCPEFAALKMRADAAEREAQCLRQTFNASAEKIATLRAEVTAARDGERFWKSSDRHGWAAYAAAIRARADRADLRVRNLLCKATELRKALRKSNAALARANP